MAVPKQKKSKSTSKKRHSTWVALNRARLIRQTLVVTCASCNEPKLSHTICPACGAQGAVKLQEVVNPDSGQSAPGTAPTPSPEPTPAK